MGEIDVSGAYPSLRRVNGNNAYGPLFQDRMTAKGKWYFFMRTRVLPQNRNALVNRKYQAPSDAQANTDEIKAMVRELGADVVGIAEYNPRLIYSDGEPLKHKFVIVFAKTMAFDTMVDIGPMSQEEVHRVYFTLDEIGVRVATRIGAFGYDARTQPNNGDFPLPAFGYLAGLGELGRHGSLLSPELGASFRLSAVSTDMPLIVDGPQDYGLEGLCQSCDLCTRFCPGDAIKLNKAEVAGVLRWYVDSDACQPYFSRLYGCKICLSVCPATARVPGLRSQYKEMAAAIRRAKDAEGMLHLINDKTPMDFSEFDRIDRELAESQEQP